MKGRRTPRAGRRAAIGAVAVVGWVLVVMIAAGPRPDDRTWIGLPALDDLMGVAFVALIIWALVWTVRVVRVGSGAKEARPANLITLWLGLAVAIAVVMANPSIVERLLDVNPADSSRSGVEEPVEEEPPAPVDFTITANQVYIALAAIGVWLGATAAARRRTVEDDGVGADDDLVDRSELSRTIDGMVEDLELGTDPRSAVLTAYDRLERALAQHDCPRRPTETPTEHLDRVLARLPIDRTPLLDLARRYEVARFSSSRVTETDRSRAATDLARIRDDLSRLARP
ncbi:MAG: DUF4129 domain-containing protein [Acidimicrobiia bacterium]|nr:DUF4129 domain-containing protein [Acidimicrobiia bacterium]